MRLQSQKTAELPLIIASLAFLAFFIWEGNMIGADAKIPKAKRPATAERDLIIYEIPTKSATSPNGPESGTFKSLEKRIPYLADLGINAVWLSGHSLADKNHFYNIWTQYACVEPDKFDPSLGTPQEFDSMVDTFHRHGVKVFLDVITHGVMKGSPLIRKHPEWFKENGKKGSWGMIDYAEKKNAPREWEEWWVGLWVDMALKHGVDGFRLDCNAKRPDLWREIKKKCAAHGVEIHIFNESHPSKGYTDAITFGQGILVGSKFHPLENAEFKTIFSKVVKRTMEARDPRKGWKGFTRSVELSCHDMGWEKYPLDKNPYVAQGRRWLMGYACLLLPAIPLMMAGEEFDCDFRPLPNLASSLFNAKNLGKGRWLYGSWIDWSQIEKGKHSEMLEDTKRLIAIRKKYAEIIHAEPWEKQPNMKTLDFKILDSEKNAPWIPKPYIQWNDEKAVLVAANPLDAKDIEIEVDAAPERFNPKWKNAEFLVTDIWNENAPPKKMTAEQLKHLKTRVKKDKTSRGGIAILEIRPATP